ncbi:MAG: TonB-dependent siderophore receptor [Reyranellaceae bacterium]
MGGFQRSRYALVAGLMVAAAGAQAQQTPAADQAAPSVLPTIPVEGSRERTEGTGSYATPTTTVGGKTPTPLRQVPQSVTVVTRSRIEDQGMTQLEDALRKSPGTLVLNNDPGRSSVFSRGFEIDNVLIDGLPAPLSSIYGTQPDLAMFDRVEILRGPGGLFAGTGEPGGTVNLARKRPLKSFGMSGMAGFGSFLNGRAELDVTGPLVEGGRVRGRAVGAFQTRDGFVDYTHNRVGLGYATVEADITDATTVSVALWHQRRDIAPFNGLPAYATGRLADVARTTFIGANWNRFDNQSTEAIAEVTHRFDNGGHAKAAVRFADRKVDFKYAYGGSAINPANGNVTLTALAREYWETSLSADAHVTTPVTLFGQTHNLVVGMDYRRYWQTMYQGQAANIGTTNIFAPNANIAEPSIAYTTRTRNVPEQFAFYGQARIKPWEPLTLVLGGRMNWYDVDSTNLVSNATTNFSVNGKFTPYAGIVFDITRNISAYASYTNVFQPQTQTTASGEVIRPREGNQYEIGIKGDFFGGGLQASAALFRIRDRNRAVSDPLVAGASVASGEVEVQGFELELSGSPLKGWQVFGGYTFTDTTYISGAAGQQGTVFSTYTPKHMVNLWTTYTFQEGWLRNFRVGVGGRIFSHFYTQSGTVRFEQDGYFVVDAMLGYKITDNVEFTLNATILFDRKYYARTGAATVFNFYGEPFSVIGTVRARF